MGSETYDVFLSHNSHDKSAVRELKGLLCGYQTPGGNPIKVWLDEDVLRPGIPWQDLLEQGIADSLSVAVLIGEDGIGPWEDEEMRAALQLAVRDKRPVIPVLLPEAPSQPKLPLFLANRTWVDLRGGFTEEGLDNLAWGITGTRPHRLPATMPTASRDSLDAILLAFSEARLAEWNAAWTNPDDEFDRLLYYVPPHYAVVPKLQSEALPDGRVPKRRTDPESPISHASTERIPGETEEETLANLLQVSDRLCLSEGPGAGKSIFTRRVQAFLSSPAGRDALLAGKPSLAVRWEEWNGSWPDDFHRALTHEVEPYCNRAAAKDEARGIAEAALADSRVVLILDALDQVGTEECIRRLSDFLTESNRRGWRLRVVMTGRPFAIEARKSTLLRDPEWRFACIEDFDAFQQYRYLYGPEASSAEGETQSDAWKARILPEDKIRRLVPQADLSGDDPDKRQRAFVTSLRNRFPNYEQISDLMGNPAVLGMVRGLGEVDALDTFDRRGDLYARTSDVMMQRAAAPLGEAADPTAIERTETVLAAIACQMMVQNPNAYRLDGRRNVARLRERAAKRVAGGIDDEQWHRVESLTHLTHQSLLYGASRDVLAWHHKGMMEFYCGLHLARNSQADWCVTETDDQGQCCPACGDPDIRRAAADPQWHWAFRFAIEMHEEVRDPEQLQASVSTLFRPVDAETDHLRPTELMHRAWSLLEGLPPHEWPDSREPVQLPDGQRIIERFRAEWEAIFNKEHGDAQQEIARQLLATFTACPSDAFVSSCGTKVDPYTFLMGGTDEQDSHDDEKPQHSVRLSPFQLMSVPVTRQHYALFDPQYERSNEEILAKRSPRTDCPAIGVSWYDAWCFARWLGPHYRLPTESQWEYACRAGGKGKWCFGNDEEALSRYAWYGEDFENGKAHPVATKEPNAWGLYDMHGNVWEWCGDWWKSEYDPKSPTVNPTGPLGGSHRVIRGGGWYIRPGICRSAYRDRYAPDYRDVSLGFRVARSPSGQQVQVSGAESEGGSDESRGAGRTRPSKPKRKA